MIDLYSKLKIKVIQAILYITVDPIAVQQQSPGHPVKPKPHGNTDYNQLLSV